MRPSSVAKSHCGVNTLALLVVVVVPSLLPALLVVPLDGRPVRFGAPLPAMAIRDGLRLEGKGLLQWRRLPIGRPDVDPVWVEIAITGPPGVVRIVAGDGPPTPDGVGPVFVREETEEVLSHGRVQRTTWRWVDGTVEARQRTTFTAPTTIAGETFLVGESLTTGDDSVTHRADLIVGMPRTWFTAIGLLPPVGGGNGVSRAVRQQLAQVLPRLPELPGLRGAGDYARSGGVVTNLEFDTTLALVRAAVGLGEVSAWHRAARAAVHLRDRDLDPRTGLPFGHGPTHRGTAPEPGHSWLQGLLWVGLLAAEDGHLVAAQNLAAALAAQPPMGTGVNERLRDYAWPLLELEALLAIAPDPVIARAADRLAASIARRFDPVARTFRFGEGEVGERVYLERGWLTAGVLLPALQAHLRRRPNARLADHVAAVQQMLLDRVGHGGPGVPTHWRLAGEQAFAEHRERQTAAAACVLETFARDDLQRLLRRPSVREAVLAMPRLDDPDLATQFSLLARCRWVWR